MSFIKIENTSQEAWNRLQFSGEFRFTCTVLEGCESTLVHALPSVALDDLDQRKIHYRLLREGELDRELTPRARELLEFLRQRDPEWPETPEELPERGHIEIRFNFASMFESRIRDILRDHGADNCVVSDVMRVSCEEGESSLADTPTSLRHMKAHVPKARYPSLFETLSNAGLAAYSPETMILRSRDPDGGN